VKKLICCLIFGIFPIWSCDTQKPSSAIPFHVCKQYGAPVSYSEGSHPGIDFEIIQGTPIIAATEGEVSFVGDSDPKVSYSGGIFVRVQSAQHFDLIYAHLSMVYVEKGQFIRCLH
jgi:murein DD-endopeptidase MepM/ murein hydrolase activator NlpD